MKKISLWMMAAILICGAATMFTSCTNEDNPAGGTGASGIAMIVKNGQIDYWRQIETAFRDACQEKNLEAYYYATTAENAYEEQLAAVEELRKLDGKKLKGIIFSPSYGLNGESAEAVFATLQTNQMTLYVPDESVDLYKATPVWKDFNVQPISAKQ